MLDIILTYIVPSLIALVVPVLLGRKQARNLQVDIEGKYQAMLNNEIEERQKLGEKFDKLEQKLERYERAYSYSIRHIRKVDPLNPVPDFLNWDTGQLQKYYRDRFGDE